MWSHKNLDKNTRTIPRHKIQDTWLSMNNMHGKIRMRNRININVYLWVWFSVRMAFDYKHQIIEYWMWNVECVESEIWCVCVMYYIDIMSCDPLCVLKMVGCWMFDWFVHHAFVQITNVLTKLFTQLKSIGNAIISHLVVTRPATNCNRFCTYSTFDMICA